MTRNRPIYLIALVTVVFTFAIVATSLPNNTRSSDINISHVEAAKLNSFEAKSREASVKVVTPSGGHGTGTLFEYKGKVFIFTAKHVTEGFSRFLIIPNSGETKEASLVYSDLAADFAVLSADGLDSIKPVKFKAKDHNPKTLIDLDVIFSGYPSAHSLLTSRGRVAGFEVDSIIIHSIAWGGSSGSSVFSSKGDFLGILFGTSVDAPFGIPTVIDNIIWVSPYYVIDWNALDRKIQENGE
tara:strand:- start:4674 stop:5396 length:723 start_codon:yes stop_codon:yes gene_type:complete